MTKENHEKVKKIFFELFQQKPEVRQQFLEKACDGDKEIRLEVESLMASYDSAESFMETPAAVEFEKTLDDKTPQLIKDQTLGNYKIIEQIGKGGMGEVYLAKDKKLDRQVAIKTLHEKFSEHKSNLERFIREAKTASGLNHPNILVIHEISETDNTQYIVSEHIEGKTLRELIKNSSLKLSQVLDFSIQIAGALSSAHKANLVHRDIKPENIMVRPDGFVKILDFGLAKLVGQKNLPPQNLEDETIKQNQTAKGVILGTVNYMSPEQAKGKKVDERTDIFSFGVVLYEMITGRNPFASKTTNETIAAILKSDPAPLTSYVANVPAELEHIVSKSLRKKPSKRYQNIEDILTDLQDLKQELEFKAKLERSVQPNLEQNLKGENETVAMPNRDSVKQAMTTAEQQNISSAEYITNTIKQNKFATFGVGITLIIAFAAFGFYGYFFTEKPIKSVAVLPFENGSKDKNLEYLSDGIAETLIGSLAQVPNLSVKARNTVFYYKGKDISPTQIGKELKVDAVLLGSIMQRGNGLKVNLELVDTETSDVLWIRTYDRQMSDLVSLQSEIAGDVSDSLKLKLSGEEKEKMKKLPTLNSSAFQAYMKGYHYWNLAPCPGEDCLEKSRQFFKRATELDSNYSQAWSGLAGITAGLPGGGRGYVPNARRAAEKALELDPQSAEAHMALGIVFQNVDWNLPAAEKELKTGLRLDPGYVANRAQYGWLLLNLGKLDEGLKEYRLAHELDPLALYTNNEFYFFLFWSRKYDEAVKHLRQAKDLDSEFSNYYNQLATVLAYQGKFTEALSECDQERAVLLRNLKKRTEGKQTLQDTIPEKGLCHAEVYALSGKETEARKILAELGANVGKDAYKNMRLRDPNLEVIWQAEIYALIGDKEKAFEELEKLSEIENEVETFYRVYADAALKFSPSLDSIREDPRFEKIKFSSVSP